MLVYLSSGMFLGWSLGANDAANIFGTAVGSKMIRFKTAAVLCSVFVVIGAVASGGGTAGTLGSLGAVNAPAGSFMVALAAGFAVYFLLKKISLPVSTSQAIVGAIVGWCYFSGTLPDYGTLTHIVVGWILCPVLAAVMSAILFLVMKSFLAKAKIHLLRMDSYIRTGLVIVGIFGAYSLGSNNIGNVVGAFISVIPFNDITVPLLGRVSGVQQLLFLGGIAIAVGIFTYSHNVMNRLGTGITQLSPQAALVAVAAESLVLFMFSSASLERTLYSLGLPSLPLVPVSSSQAVIGAIMGIAIIKGGRGVKYRVVGQIVLGWVAAPLLAGLVAYFGLFFLQNVFNLQVHRPSTYVVTPEVEVYLHNRGISSPETARLLGRTFRNAILLDSTMKKGGMLDGEERKAVVWASEVIDIGVDNRLPEFHRLDEVLSAGQFSALKLLQGRSFRYRWQFARALAALSPEWNAMPPTTENIARRKSMQERFETVIRILNQHPDDDGDAGS